MFKDQPENNKWYAAYAKSMPTIEGFRQYLVAVANQNATPNPTEEKVQSEEQESAKDSVDMSPESTEEIISFDIEENKYRGTRQTSASTKKSNEVGIVYMDDIPENCDLTDEISKSLLDLKGAYGLGTEEVEKAIGSRAGNQI